MLFGSHGLWEQARAAWKAGLLACLVLSVLLAPGCEAKGLCAWLTMGEGDRALLCNESTQLMGCAEAGITATPCMLRL